MRVLVLQSWGERLGGAETLLQSVLEGSRESGQELELVFFEPGSWPDELAAEGYPVTVIEAGRLRQPHRWLSTVVRLARLMRSRRPDLILGWSGKAHLYGSPAAVLAGMTDRVVWWQHATPSRLFALDRLATVLPAAAVGCCSRAAAVSQTRMWPTRKVFVVNAGSPVPSPNGGPATLELPSEVPIVGLVGRLQPWKGQDRLLRAQAILRDRGHAMHLMIVGGDSYGLSPEYATSLPLLIRDLGLQGAVTMTGEVPDAGPYMERMDVLVNASEEEPFGIVLLEGMARSVPVVAVDNGGPAEFIEHSRTGMLASSGDPQALADTLEPLLRSPELRRDLGSAGRERFMAEFTDAALRQRMFDALEALVPAGAAGSARDA